MLECEYLVSAYLTAHRHLVHFHTVGPALAEPCSICWTFRPSWSRWASRVLKSKPIHMFLWHWTRNSFPLPLLWGFLKEDRETKEDTIVRFTLAKVKKINGATFDPFSFFLLQYCLTSKGFCTIAWKMYLVKWTGAGVSCSPCLKSVCF